MEPEFSFQFEKPKSIKTFQSHSKRSFLIPSFIALLLFIFICFFGYRSNENLNELKIKQELIEEDLIKQSQNTDLLSKKLQNEFKQYKETQVHISQEFSSFNESLKEQNESLKSIRYWNYRQSKQLENLQSFLNKDSVTTGIN